MVEACRARRGQSRAWSSASARRGLAGRARQDLPPEDAGGFGLGRAAARGVDGEGGQGPGARARRAAGRARPAARRGARRRPVRARRRSSSAGSSRPPSPGTCSASTPSTSRTCRPRRTRRARCWRAGEPALEPEGSLDELLARRPARATTSRSWRSSTRRATPSSRRCVARARETGCVVTPGFGPRYLHSTGQLHKGGPNTGLFVQVVDDTGEELRSPARDFGFGRLIRAQAAGDIAALEERGRRVVRTTTGGGLDEDRHGRPRAGWAGDDAAASRHGHEVATYDPNVSRRRRRSARSRSSSSAPRAVWVMVPSGDITEDTFQSCSAPRARRRDRRRRQLELPRLAAPLQGGAQARRSTSSTPASRAASGASRSASA